jgi:outer membrane immunogenic protein
MMRGICASIAVLAAGSGAAFAADIPMAPAPAAPAYYAPAPPPVYNWTGYYIGVNGGYGFASGNTTATVAGGPFNGLSATGSGNISGGVAGGQMGFNYQINQLVVGMEGDFDWSGQSKTDSIGVLSETVKLPWIATIRGRAGIAIDRALLYGTGGVAFTEASDNVTAAGVGTLFSASSVNAGWTIGAGAEFALAQNWTARVEYLYVGTNVKLSGPFSLIAGNINETANVSDSIVRAGVNFKYP